MSSQCKGNTLKGVHCTRKTKSDYCRFHKSQTSTRIFTVAHEDGWHSGPHLEMFEKGMEGYFSDSDDEDLPMNAFTNVEFKLNNHDFHVFHLIMYFEECEVRLLKVFKTEEEAETYAKQQYFLTTGNYPFVDEE